MKTGGSTLKTVIDKWVRHSTRFSESSSVRDHTIKEIPIEKVVVRGRFGLGDSFWFSTCRHPIARSKSHYFHCLRAAHIFLDQNRQPPKNSCGATALKGFEFFLETSRLVHDYQWSFIGHSHENAMQVVFHCCYVLFHFQKCECVHLIPS